MKRHFLQSADWMKFQRALGRQTLEASGDGWSYQAVVEGSNGGLGALGKRLYVPYGPTAETSAGLKLALDDLKRVARKQGATYARVEPYPFFSVKALLAAGLKKSARNSQPDLTLIVDLSKSEEELLAEMSSANRRMWRRIDETGLSFELSHEAADLEDFIAMTDFTIKRTGARLHTGNYLRTLFTTLAPEKVAGVAYAIHDGKRLAGIFFIDDLAMSTRYYMYAASFEEARQHACGPAVAAYLMFSAQKSGISHFDFFGVSPAEAKDHAWAGLSAFKRSFGGHEVQFNGTWELPVHKLSHLAIRQLRPLASKVKRLIKR